MPELPEVETIKSELSPHLIGRRFTDVTVRDAKAVRQPSVEEFRQKLTGKKINSLERRGKYLIFHLSDGMALIIHLKMTGVLLLNPEQTDQHARVIFNLDNGSQLIFIDRRPLTPASATCMPMKLCLSPEFTRLKKQTAFHPRKYKPCTKPLLKYCGQP